MQLQQITDKSLYDDLTTIMQIIAKNIRYLEKIIKMKSINSDQSIAIQQLQCYISKLTQLSRKYNKNSFEDQQQVLIRFRCRIREMVEIYSNNYIKSLVFADLSNFLIQITQNLQLFHKDRDFGKFLIKITNNMIKFTQIIIQKCSKDIINTKLTMIGTHLQEKKTFLNDQQSKQFSMIKMLQNVNKRFCNLIGMDLDQRAFRSQYFQSRNKDNSLFQNYLQRNKIISEQIQLYQKNYSRYINKKKLKLKKFGKRYQTQVCQKLLLGSQKINTQQINNQNNQQNTYFIQKGYQKCNFESSAIQARMNDGCKKKNIVKTPLQLRNIMMVGNGFFEDRPIRKSIWHSSKRGSIFMARVFTLQKNKLNNQIKQKIYNQVS